MNSGTPGFASPPPPPKREWYQKKRWWIGGAVLLLLIVGAIGGGSSDSTDSTASESTSQSPASSTPTTKSPSTKSSSAAKAKVKAAPKPKPKPAALKVNAGQMLKEFKGNEAAADAKYKGKVVEVTGHVAKVDTEFLDEDQYVVRLDGGDQFAILSVNCNDVEAGQAARVKADGQATVRGTFDDGGDLGIEIADCKVL